MIYRRKRYSGIIAMTLAVVFIFGCGGKGLSMPSVPYVPPFQASIKLTWQDSLVQEMVDIINPGTMHSKSDRNRIERKIKSFPHKIERRDTAAYFLRTAYAIAYYEFCKKDYKTGLKYSQEFQEKAILPGFMNAIFDYSSVVFHASMALRHKGRLKSKKDKNDWAQWSFPVSNDSVFHQKRGPVQFIDAFLDDVPLDLDITTYHRLLSFFHDNGGRLELLNSVINAGFFHKAKIAGRDDVFKAIFTMWGVDEANFGYDKSTKKYSFRIDNKPKEELDKTPIGDLTNTVFQFDPERNIVIMDSLIQIGKYDAIPQLLLKTLGIYYDRSQYRDLVSCCYRYAPYVSGATYATLNNYMGLALSNLGDYEASLRCYDEAIAFATSPDNRSTMRLNKACTLGEIGRYAEAIDIFMAEKKNQDSAFDKFCWYDNLGYIYSGINPHVALYYYNKAELYLDNSSFYEIRKVRHFCRKAQLLTGNKYLQRNAIEEALKFTRKEFCSDVAKGMAYTEYGAFLSSIYDYAKAKEYYSLAKGCFSYLSPEDSRLQRLNGLLEMPDEKNTFEGQTIEGVKREVIQTLLSLSQSERGSMLYPLQKLIDTKMNSGNYADALSLSLFRKGLLLTTRQSVEKKVAAKRGVKKKYRELQSLRAQLSEATAMEDTIHIPQLGVKIANIERDLSAKMLDDRSVYREIDKTLAHIQGNLRNRDIAIEFINYDTRYGAFVIFSDGRFDFVEIPNPEKVWNALQSYLTPVGNIYFCPDGEINNIAIEFLKDDDGVPMSQKYHLHRVFHLADIQRHGGIGNDMVVVGVSDHNSPIGEAETINRGTMSDLPNVEYEMKLIQERVDAGNLNMLYNDDATEVNLKSLDHEKVSALHISTHGIYRDNATLKASAENPVDDDYYIARRMLKAGKESLSGLILRQGNMSWKSDKIMEDNDDILTSDEIENMTFPNLQLTVLSACDTGLGDIDSEGVWGLQRAFRIAGSNALICSLQKIDDYWSAQFMDAFYEYAGQGQTIYDSFHHAQRILYEADPNHPEIWSSFILIE